FAGPDGAGPEGAGPDRSGAEGTGVATARVQPETVPAGDLLARIDGVANAVVCRARPVGEVTIIGPGAGPQLAGQGVLSDLVAGVYAECAKGRPTVPARVVATVMLLQSCEGLSDREACDRLEVDLRWQAAAGVDAGYWAFHPTVLVGMRNRLRASARPRRLFE